jgi:hypothetical protein
VWDTSRRAHAAAFGLSHLAQRCRLKDLRRRIENRLALDLHLQFLARLGNATHRGRHGSATANCRLGCMSSSSWCGTSEELVSSAQATRPTGSTPAEPDLRNKARWRISIAKKPIGYIIDAITEVGGASSAGAKSCGPLPTCVSMPRTTSFHIG